MHGAEGTAPCIRPMLARPNSRTSSSRRVDSAAPSALRHLRPYGPQNASRSAICRLYSAAVVKRAQRHCGPADAATVLGQLRSPDARVRISALHSLCPCAAGFPGYERFRGEVKRLQKDPDPGVRAAALHVERDASEIEMIDAGLDRAREQGWHYSDVDWVRKKRQRQASRYWLPRGTAVGHVGRWR